MDGLRKNQATESINNTADQTENRRNNFTVVEDYRSPYPQSFLSKLINRHSSSEQSPTATASSLGKITMRSSAREKVEALKKVQTTMLALIESSAKGNSASVRDRYTLGELVTQLSTKLRDGDMFDAKKKDAASTEKAVRRLLSVLDPTVLKSLSRQGIKSYTIAPQLGEKNQIAQRFGSESQKLLEPQHRAAALANLARTWERNRYTSYFTVNSNLKVAVASTLVDYLCHENRDTLLRPTEEQAFDMAACLIQEVLPLSFKNVMVDPMKTFSITEKYKMPDTYDGRSRKAEDVSVTPLPEQVLEAFQYITQSLPANDSRRNMLGNRLRAVDVPQDSSWADVPVDDYDRPLIPFEDINKFNDRLATLKQSMDNIVRALLS